MAKMFYNMEEVQEKLGRSEKHIKELVQQGKLREFRDGHKIMFKVDEVDVLALEDSGGGSDSGQIDLEPLGDSSDQISLTPEEAQKGAEQDYELNLDGSGTEIGLAPPDDSADQIRLDDSATKESKDDTVITSHGINVLEDSDDEIEAGELIDPMAQTQIAPDLADQVHLDSGSSGSGLLDLTREADDTSLGAELLEDIYPEPTGTEGAIETQVPSGLDIPAQSQSMLSEQALEDTTIRYAQAAEIIDPASGAFGIMMLIPLLFLVVLACATGAGMTGIQPQLLVFIGKYNAYVVFGGGVLALLIVGIGMFIANQSATPSKPKTKGKKKTKKEKKSKKK